MTDTKKLIEQARKLAEIQREQAIVEKAIEVSLLPADPVAPSNITPQEAFNGTWDAVKKVNEKVNEFASIKDISSANTYSEMYALLETGKSYNWKGSILYCFDKQPTQAGVRGFGLTPNKDYAVIGKWIKNTADAISLDIPSDLDRLSVYTPTGDNHAANKKYVDDKVAGIDLSHKQDTLTKTLTLVFDDGTTEDIKVG